MTRAPVDDADLIAVRRATRTVGVQITIASIVVVLAIVTAAFTFVLSHVHSGRLLDARHEATIDVGALDILQFALVVGVIAVVLAALLSWFVTRRAVRPLGEALRLQRAFVANASHELRTPLAVLDARLQLLQRRTPADAPSGDTIAELRRDTATLIQIVNDLLETAENQPDGGVPPVSMPEVAQLAVDSMRLLAAERDIAIDLDVEAEVVVAVPAASIHRCVVALLDNALKHSPAGSSIQVRIGWAGPLASLSVRDHGTGIVGIEPSHVFDRFARGDSGADKGFGIGLSLVRDTANRHGGTAQVVRTGPEGTEIVVTFARSAAARRRRRSLD